MWFLCLFLLNKNDLEESEEKAGMMLLFLGGVGWG